MKAGRFIEIINFIEFRHPGADFLFKVKDGVFSGALCSSQGEIVNNEGDRRAIVILSPSPKSEDHIRMDNFDEDGVELRDAIIPPGEFT